MILYVITSPSSKALQLDCASNKSSGSHMDGEALGLWTPPMIVVVALLNLVEGSG